MCTSNLTTSADPQPWALHPGLAWAEALHAAGMTDVEAARRSGTSVRHLTRVLTGHALPSAALTVRFAEVVETSPRLLWQLKSNYELALALGADDVTPLAR